VTLRVCRGLPSLRTRRLVADLRRRFAPACERGRFRLVHYSIQADHLHLIVEATSARDLANGMKAIAARLARGVNRFVGRSGSVLADRYHLRILRTPREVRSALAYVLLNVRKHWWQHRGVAPPLRMDEASSGRWFEGWRSRPPESPGAGSGPREVAGPRTWLLAVGWRRHGLIDPAEVPGN
jgi:REP element-mobilizing transposase RayT